VIACGGDALIDFVPVRTADGGEAFAPRVGGSCLNVAVTLARLGAPTTFIGGVSRDLFGEMIAAHMAAAGVATDRLIRSDRETTLAFVRMDGTDARYAFYDDNTAGRNWAAVPGTGALDGLEALHVGSVTLIADPAASAYEALAAAAVGRGMALSFDPNCRPSLVADRDAYAARMARLAAMAHLVRYSEEDLAWLRPGADEAAAAGALLDAGVGVALITRGQRGATAFWAGGRVDCPARAVTVADTIGAGDTFHGAFLHAARAAGLLTPRALRGLDRATVAALLDYATAAAAITCGRVGCDPPTEAELGDPSGWFARTPDRIPGAAART